MKMRAPLILLLCFFSIHSATASTVQELYLWCQQTNNSNIETKSVMQRWRCNGQIQGVLETMMNVGFVYNDIASKLPDAAKKFLPYVVCADPKDITFGAARQAFMSWSEKHPEKQSWSTSWGLAAALAETWPCKAPQ